MDPTVASELAQTRAKYRAELETALTEDADPLAAYDSFVKWTVDSYGPHLAQSGLLELLEEATRRFVDDDGYKSDLRYLKLWLLYAKHVEDPTRVYGFVQSKGIGRIYAQLYQDHADELERRGRREQAELIYTKGIGRRARPLEPLKRRFEEFKLRASAPPPRSTVSSSVSWQNAPDEVRALRLAPFKNHPAVNPPDDMPPPPPPAHPHQSPPKQHSMQGWNPYAMMLAPPAPGKRKEKLRFNLSLLFTDEGVEYSMQEARARSMGLLGKKWGPPPQPERERRVGFSGDPGKDTKSTRKFAVGAEPTVTLATKEALADVFGMYNSPEKSMRFGPAAGSKHAPVRRVDPVTPVPLAPLLRTMTDESANTSKTLVGFKPFVDENAQRKNKTPAATPKITPFVDPDAANKSVVTPNPNRPALSVKDPSALALSAKQDENSLGLKKKLAVHIDSDAPPKPPPVFSLTPASATFRNRPDLFSDDAKGSGENIFRPASAGATKFMPFSDENAPKVFSRPPPKSENTPAPTFTPFVEKPAPSQPLSSSASGRPVLGERTPLRPVLAPLQSEPEPESEREEPGPESEAEKEEEPEHDQEQEQDEQPETPTTESDADARSRFELEQSNSRDALTSESSSDDFDGYIGYEQPAEEAGQEVDAEAPLDDDSDTNGYRVPLGGRFGQFNVMTPITERTYEFTMSTHASGGTPGFSIHRDAAEQLAAQLEEDEDEDEAEEVVNIEERTGTLSLADALDVASSFKPPNPCNPFDPPIIATLLRLIPPDPGFHDLRSEESGQLDGLQKFAKRKTRRASGTSASGRSMQDGETLELALHDRHFAVVDKLGEGGFGAVFEAIDLDMKAKRSHGSDADSDGDEDEDEDGEEANRVALKVVKPRNLWEFHVLRRIHATLPAPLRRSIVTPQALYAFRDESFLVLELRKQGTLLDIVNRAPAAGLTQAGACLDELLVMFFAAELLRVLDGLHRAGFIHGDVKIDNCLLRIEDVPGPASAWDARYDPSGARGWAHKGLTLIDFGRTLDTRLFPAGQRYVAEWPTDARDCLEMREGRPWTFQTDYFGLAGIIYCMLYGKYIEAASVVPAPEQEQEPGHGGRVRYRLATPFKRYWQGELWTRLFDVLLNPTLVRPDGALPVTDELAALRAEMEAWLQANCNRASNSLKGLLKKVGLAILKG